jgi:hypothetical protein
MLIGSNDSNVEFFPKWICLECDKENDITNPVRCYNCLAPKPTPDELKAKLAELEKQKKKKHQEGQETKVELMKISEDDYDAQGTNQVDELEFDLSKLES